MAQGILPGLDVVQVKADEESYHIVYGFREFSSFGKNDAASLRMNVVQLASMGVRKTTLRRTFGMGRSTIDRWIALYEEGGLQALASLKTGPRAKLTDSVREYILAVYKRTGNRYAYLKTIQAEVAALYGTQLSRESIRLVLNEWRSANEACDGDAPDEGSESEALGTEMPGGEDAAPGDIGRDGSDARGEANHVVHGGALLTLPLLEEYGVADMVPRGPSKKSNGYSFLECFFSIFFLLAARLLKVEENIKLHDDPGLGGLIGRARLPSLRTVRHAMAVLVEKVQKKLEATKVGFAKRCLELRDGCKTFYFDGHFMPYSGEEKTLKGYNSGRRLAEKGRTAYAVNRAPGRPIYEVLSDGFDHFHDNVRRLADVLRGDLGVERPMVVMDRGGFGEDLFQSLEPKADFICWRLGKPKVPKGAKWEKVKIPLQSNLWDEPEYETVKATEKVIAKGNAAGIGCRRVLFIKRGKKISPAITCKRDATLEELVLDLSGRWGAQENPFKELKADGYDCLHS